jgi:hypothetical protein
MLSLRAMVVPNPELDLTVGFRLGDELFHTRMEGGRYEVSRAHAMDGDLTFDGRTNPVAAVIYGPRPFEKSVVASGVAFQGDPTLGQAFVDCFVLGTGAKGRGAKGRGAKGRGAKGRGAKGRGATVADAG